MLIGASAGAGELTARVDAALAAGSGLLVLCLVATLTLILPAARS